MAAQKKLEPGSEYAKYDLDGDGVVTDEELAMDEKLLRLQDLKSDIENEDKKEDAQRMMAWFVRYVTISITSGSILLVWYRKSSKCFR